MQNGVQQVDSPIKKVAKRSRQILESDEEEEAPVVKEQVASKGQGVKEPPSKTEKVRCPDILHGRIADVLTVDLSSFFSRCTVQK